MEGTVPAVRVIEEQGELASWLERLACQRGASRVALDIEGDGLFRYRGRICTIQLEANGEIVILDALAFPVAAHLGALLGEQGPEKVVHDAAFDGRMLYAEGVPLGRVFDTAVAARFLGYASTGLSSLIASRFQVDLEKAHQQADWAVRPLTAPMLTYLENDVRYLGRLSESLLEEVRALDIEAEVREECAYVLAQAALPAPRSSPWMRIKGAWQLAPPRRALLRALADVREALAQALDVPPGRLISNDAMLRFVGQAEPGEAGLGGLLGAPLAAHLEPFIAAFRRGLEAEDAPTEEVLALAPPALAPWLREARKRRRKALTEFRAREAAARGVDIQVVMPGHCLADLVELDGLDVGALRTIAGLGACRIERYGAELVRELGPRW